MRKIISFSIYGKADKYVEGAILNGKLQEKIYPGWTCRFYVADDVPTTSVSKLLDWGEVVTLPREKGHLPMFWRMRPFEDPSVDRFIVRDTDSRLNRREADAVAEWEDSPYPFHIMRDHEQHAVPICGGMYGAVRGVFPEWSYSLSEYLRGLMPTQIFHIRGQYFNTDQPFLWRYLWPKIARNHIAHIANIESLKIIGNERLFRTTNEDRSFVGQPFEVSA